MTTAENATDQATDDAPRPTFRVKSHIEWLRGGWHYENQTRTATDDPENNLI